MKYYNGVNILLYRTIYKGVDNSVTGGTILYDSPILLRATSTGDSSVLSKIGQ